MKDGAASLFNIKLTYFLETMQPMLPFVI